MILSICDEFQFQGKLSYIRYINIIIELILQNSNKILIVYIKRSLTTACTIKTWNIYTMYSEEPMNYVQCDYSTLPIFGIWSCYCFCLLSYLSSINWQFLCISCIAIPTRNNRPVAKIRFSKKKSSLAQMQMFAI